MYIYGASCKAKNFNVDLHLAMLKAISFYLLHNVLTLINAESYPVSQLCVNTLPVTKITLITDGI
jgi:hypothetical protein